MNTYIGRAYISRAVEAAPRLLYEWESRLESSVISSRDLLRNQLQITDAA